MLLYHRTEQVVQPTGRELSCDKDKERASFETGGPTSPFPSMEINREMANVNGAVGAVEVNSTTCLVHGHIQCYLQVYSIA